MRHRRARCDSRVADRAIYAVLFIRVIFSAITRRILRTHFTRINSMMDVIIQKCRAAGESGFGTEIMRNSCVAKGK